MKEKVKVFMSSFVGMPLPCPWAITQEGIKQEANKRVSKDVHGSIKEEVGSSRGRLPAKLKVLDQA